MSAGAVILMAPQSLSQGTRGAARTYEGAAEPAAAAPVARVRFAKSILFRTPLDA